MFNKKKDFFFKGFFLSGCSFYEVFSEKVFLLKGRFSLQSGLCLKIELSFKSLFFLKRGFLERVVFFCIFFECVFFGCFFFFLRRFFKMFFSKVLFLRFFFFTKKKKFFSKGFFF